MSGAGTQQPSTPAPAPIPGFQAQPTMGSPQPQIRVVPPPPLKPKDPLMGTCEETFMGSNVFYYVFGGKPKADWSGIQDLSDRSMSDLCFRSLDPVAGQKSSHYRTKGLSTKFGTKSNLADFQTEVWDHLVKHGLDTISYLPDPRNNSQVLCAVTKHAQMTGDMRKTEALAQYTLNRFDTWDKKHDSEAKSFLLASMTEDLKKDFKPFYDKETDTFALVWLKLIHYLVSSTSRTFDKLKDDVRNIKPQQYAGQNIEKMSADYIQKSEELVNAGYFDPSLILNMVDGFLCASKDAKGTFHHNMNDLRRKVEKLQQATLFMSRQDQMDEYARERLSYKDVCFAAVKEYKTLCDDNMWEPKKLPKDRQAPATGAANLAEITRAFNLIANMPSQGGSQGNKEGARGNPKRNKGTKGGPLCYNCGKAGHVKKDCPEPSKTPQERKTIRHQNMAAWKKKAPAVGESHTKVVDGKTYHWCKKCENWTPTHNTEQHTGPVSKNQQKKPGKKRSKKNSNFSAETNLTSLEPQAWMVEFEREDPLFTFTNLLKYGYFVLTLGILLGLPVPTYTTLVDLWSQTSEPKEMLAHVLVSSMGTIHQWMQGTWIAVGPICWFALGYVACNIPAWHKLHFDPTHLSPTSRTLRRQSRSRSRSLSRPKYKIRSARSHGLTPKYPLHLRNRNQFNTRRTTPTIAQRLMQTNLDNWVQSSAPNYGSSSRGTSSPTDSPQSRGSWSPQSSNKRRIGQSRSPPSPLHSYKSKGGNRRQRKYSDEILRPTNLARKLKGSNPHHPCCTTSHKRSFCPTARSPPHEKPCYVPTGIRTRRDSPNLNLTVYQHKKMKKTAHSVPLMGASPDQQVYNIARSISMLTPSGFKAAVTTNKKESQFPIVWDSGASVCVTPDRNDFTLYRTTTDIKTVKGVGGNNSTVVGQGEVEWSICDINGSLRKFVLPAFHIPTCKARLISTTGLLTTYQGEYITINENSLTLSGIRGDPERAQVIAFNNPFTRLPTTTGYISRDSEIPTQALHNVVTTVSEQNHNLGEAQKELLKWHQKLGHLDFNKIKHLLRTGVLSHTDKTRNLHTVASKIEHPPKCAACLFGKQTITSAPGKTVKVVKDRAGVLRAGNLLPGQEVSVDHFVSSVRGRLFTGYNRGSIEDRYVGGCIFVDHASSYIHVEFQSSLSSHETLAAKLEYEKHCRDAGVIPQKYMSDNGKAFTAREFSEHLSKFHQISKLAGVGAHHHNAQAERAIRTIMSIARTMMIHSGIYWPDMADATLWPMAVKHACFLYNHVPSHTTGLSPADLFTKTRWPQRKFLDLHVWGCPVYVLEKSLQDGKKIPKWRPRSKRSIHMGLSHSHASTVPLVLNTSTGAITPQFHVVFDDWFATVGSDHDNLPDFSSQEWSKLFGESSFQYNIDDDEENEQTSDLIDTLRSQYKADKIGQEMDKTDPTQSLEVEEPISSPQAEKDSHKSEMPEASREASSHLEQTIKKTDSPQHKKDITSTEVKQESEEDTPQKKMSPVKRQPARRRKGVELLEPGSIIGSRRPRRSGTEIERLTYTHDKSSFTGKTNLVMLEVDDERIHVHYVTPDCHVMVSSSKENNPDLFSYDEAMSSEFRSEWIKAAIKEIEALENFGCWEEIPIEEATTKVLPGTWVFKVKRAPDGSFKKFKARYCIRGDLQEGEFETYAPVVQFSSVRLFLAWSLMLGWYTCSVDFSNAFIQADLKAPTFIHLPRGFRGSGSKKTCLRLKKSLYGLAVAPRLWYQHLCKALKDLGLKESKHDPCLMTRKDLIVICYVDDLGIQAPNKEIVDKLIGQLKQKGFDLTLEGSFSEYLGIQYTKLGNTKIKMSQEGLIKKILEATQMEDCNSNRTPTTKEPLGSDDQGEPMEDPWNYRSVIGMLLYLSTNTRPDISYAVSQVARFSHNPKKSHATAVKMIIRYLAGTRDQGVIYERPSKLQVDCFVDADFAGLYGKEPPESPISVKSRTGYIISVGGCYILCKSQLQSTIALSTSEAEYGALSQAMRAVIPIRETLLEMIMTVDMVDTRNRSPFGSRATLSSFPTVIHEDNAAALGLAVNQKVTSRTKHWCVKFHFFWSYVNDTEKNTKCVKVDTKEQKADYLTKGLTKDAFEHCRFLNQGW